MTTIAASLPLDSFARIARVQQQPSRLRRPIAPRP
jgi:hypothetical protein